MSWMNEWEFTQLSKWSFKKQTKLEDFPASTAGVFCMFEENIHDGNTTVINVNVQSWPADTCNLSCDSMNLEM